jgi:hypothetical protein
MSVRFEGNCKVRLTSKALPTIPAYWFTVKVYDTADQLCRAAAKYEDEPYSEWTGTGAASGVFHSVDISDKRPLYLGVMRLCDQFMSPELIIHESVHAACALARAYTGGPLILGSDNVDTEEVVAYATENISSSLIDSPVLTKSPQFLSDAPLRYPGQPPPVPVAA